MRRALSCFIWSVTCPYTSRVKAAVAWPRLPCTVLIADLFAVPELDTRDAGQMRDYIMDGWGSHPNLRCCREFYIPAIVEALVRAEDL